MTPTLTTRLLLFAILLAALVGVVDAVIDETWDHVVLFGVPAVLAVVLLARMGVGRTAVRLRSDHVHWLAARADLSGESIEQIADRAVATYRYALDDEADAVADGAEEPAGG